LKTTLNQILFSNFVNKWVVECSEQNFLSIKMPNKAEYFTEEMIIVIYNENAT